eukprot:SAG22_NODE_1265_length_4958_cov_61.157440_5_plen_135_part_00
MKTSVVSCLLQVLSDNAFLRVKRRGLDHPYNKLTNYDKKGQNYLVVPAGANPQMFFVLNEYKTRKKYGEKKVDIKDPEIITSLKIWLKHRPTQTDSLFYDTGRDFSVPANSASITKILLGASKRLLDGKSVGSK